MSSPLLDDRPASRRAGTVAEKIRGLKELTDSIDRRREILSFDEVVWLMLRELSPLRPTGGQKETPR